MARNLLGAVVPGERWPRHALRPACPGWEQCNPVLKQNVSAYVDGSICPKCGYNAEFLELPFFTVTENGLEFVPQEKQKAQ